MSKIDHFPIVKRHIERLPVKIQRETYRLIERELAPIDVLNLCYADMMMLESDLHDLIDYWLEEYYESRKDLPND